MTSSPSKCLLSKAQISQWLVDLRSGEFPQVQQSLHDCGGYCCLGVLAQRLGTLETSQEDGNDEHVVKGKNVLGFEDELIDMNDKQKMDFPSIADWIERELLPSAPDEMAPGALLPYVPEEDF
jgi:hypothetical protein